jgi:ubiquinone/menaquinone biosynthesis C-methylase UbiE
MYSKSAKYYDAIYSFVDYAGASAKLRALIQEQAPNAQSLLDVACGTGKHCEFIDRDLAMIEGLDISPELLEVACARLPHRTFHQGDMAAFSLGKTFDVVTCLFSAIGYAETLERMQAAIRNMAAHAAAGGLVVVEPWFSPQTYWSGHITANHVDEKDLKISWMYIAQKVGLVSVFDINYLVGTPQSVDHFKEEHRLGLFTHEQYLDAFAAAGLEVSYDAKGLVGRGMYVGRRRQEV